MTNTEITEYLEKCSHYDGERSIIYPYIKDKIDVYNEYEIPYKEEFIFFEDRYSLILKDIKSRGLKAKRIIDIGCQYGVQSELFKNDYEYVGIDTCDLRFFNDGDPKCKYIVGEFPFLDVSFEDSIVISSMSLGYFGIENNNEIAKKLREAEYLYIATSKEMMRLIENGFDKEYIEDDAYVKNNPNCEKKDNVSNNLYFMESKRLAI